MTERFRTPNAPTGARLTRRAFGALSLSGLAACATPDPLSEAQREMGDFQLLAPIVVTTKIKAIPPSRAAAPSAWEAVMKDELTRRFGRYAGGRDYYVALSIDGFSLAPPGIPIVLTPKSILVVTANLWTADPQEKVRGPEQLTTFEGADTLFLGSGLMKDGDAQMRTLARNMAFKVQSWILREPTLLGLPSGPGAPAPDGGATDARPGGVAAPAAASVAAPAAASVGAPGADAAG